MGNAVVNRTYKDRLFRLVFRKPEDLLTLYNAVNGSDYDRPEELVITTLEDVIYLSMKNDVSFLFGDVLNLYEQQSSFNPNMPIRGLIYLTKLYQQFISANELNLYGSTQLKLPFPQYIVFYNGLKEEPERLELKLADSFEVHSGLEPSLAVTAIMLNINWGANQKLMEQCRQLADYSYFVAEVRLQQERYAELNEAIDKAIEHCIQNGKLTEILSTYRKEVVDMLFTEYDEQRVLAGERKEGKAEGIAIGIAEGKAIGIVEGKAASILELLEEKGPIPDSLSDTILAQTDLAVLSAWLKRAARAGSIREFTDAL